MAQKKQTDEHVDKRLLVGLAVFSLMVAVATVFLSMKNGFSLSDGLFEVKQPIQISNGSSQSPQEDHSPEDTKTSYSLELSADDTNWNQGELYDVRVNVLPEVRDDLIAASFVIEYDPDVTEVFRSRVGDAWGQTNVLKTDVNSEDGSALLWVGRGFDTNLTGNTTLATFTFRAVSATESAEIRLVSGTELGLSDTNVLKIPDVTPLTISIEQ